MWRCKCDEELFSTLLSRFADEEDTLVQAAKENHWDIFNINDNSIFYDSHLWFVEFLLNCPLNCALLQQELHFPSTFLFLFFRGWKSFRFLEWNNFVQTNNIPSLLGLKSHLYLYVVLKHISDIFDRTHYRCVFSPFCSWKSFVRRDILHFQKI